MKKTMILFGICFLVCSTVYGQVRGQVLQKRKALVKISSEERPWRSAPAWKIYKGPDKDADIIIRPDEKKQKIEGFGGAFNEKGWEALSLLSPQKREEVIKALFDPVKGANINIGRVPIGASDFALNRYTHNEVPDDFTMEFFSIERDRKALIPYIKAAMKHRPNLKVWGSAWTPPTWMKTNGAFDSGSMKDDPKIYDAYALYLARFIEEYRREGVNLYAVAVQSEPAMRTMYPSCFWRPEQIQTFIRNHMGPTFERRHLRVDIILGTFRNDNFETYPEKVLSDPRASKYVSIVGYQWEGLKAVDPTRRKYPEKSIMQTETDAGNWPWREDVFNPQRPPNDWSYGSHTWNKIREYFAAGVNSYMLWNMVLDEEGKNLDSERPWPQNAAIVVDKNTKNIVYTPMYYAFRHVTAFVEEDAYYLVPEGTYPNLVAFVNPNGEVILVLENGTTQDVKIKINIGDYWMYGKLPPVSWTTIRIPALK